MQTQTENENRARNNALAWFESIVETVDAWRAADRFDTDANPLSLGWVQNDEWGRFYTWDGRTYDDAAELRKAVEARMHESALRVEVRSDWYEPGAADADKSPAEYRIPLTNGGPALRPALRLVGELLWREGLPVSARLEYRGWGTPWTPLTNREIELLTGTVMPEAYLLDFAHHFCFGGG